MTELHTSKVAGEVGIKLWQILSAGSLLQEGATVPFIGRYRKEQTGSLDETAIARLRDRLAQLTEIDKRRDAILKSLDLNRRCY
jgi:uncharacterized protein